MLGSVPKKVLDCLRSLDALVSFFNVVCRRTPWAWPANALRTLEEAPVLVQTKRACRGPIVDWDLKFRLFVTRPTNSMLLKWMAG